MLSHILKSIICEEYRNIHQLEDEGINTNAMKIEFSLSRRYDVVNNIGTPIALADGYYPILEVLIYGEITVIGVYTRTYDVHNVLKPKGQWETVWSHHTSCWSDDGVGRIIRKYGDDLDLIGKLGRHWFGVVKVDDDLRGNLQQLVRKRYNRGLS